MPKVTFVIGLCGSGKSWHADCIHAEAGAKQFEGLVGKKQFPEVIRWLQGGNDCVVEEISCCHAEFRQVFVRDLSRFVPGLEIEWLCLENDLESANWNVLHRSKGDVAERIEINGRVPSRYTYPEGCTPIPVVRIDPKSPP